MAGTQYRGSEIKDVDQFLKDADGLESEREKEIGQHIGYRYDVNLVPDYERITPFLKKYIEVMGECSGSTTPAVSNSTWRRRAGPIWRVRHG